MGALVCAAVFGGMIAYGLTDQARKSGEGIILWLGIIAMIGTIYSVLSNK